MADHIQVTFRTFYHVTSPDHVVALVGSTICLGSWDPAKSLILYEDESSGAWQVTTRLQVGGSFDWKFAILNKRTDKVIQWEDVANRHLVVGRFPIEIELPWNGKETIKCIESAACDKLSPLWCAEGVVVRSTSNQTPPEHFVNATFKIKFIPRADNEVVAIVGSDKSFGSWNPENALVCEPFGSGGCWVINAQLPENAMQEWKLACLDRASQNILRWEGGPNRQLYVEYSSLEVVVPWGIKEVVRYSRPPTVIYTPLERKSSDLDCSRKNTVDGNSNGNAMDSTDRGELIRVFFDVNFDPGFRDVALCVAGSCKALGLWDPDRAIRLNRQRNGNVWQATVRIPKHTSTDWKLILLEGGRPIWEQRHNRWLNIHYDIEVRTSWNAHEQIHRVPTSIGDFVQVTFKTGYHLDHNQVLAVVGGSVNVGLWDTREALFLDQGDNDNHWSAKQIFVAEESFEWKLAVLDKHNLHVVRWEEYGNRVLRIGTSSLEVVVPWGKREAIREVKADPRKFCPPDDTEECSCQDSLPEDKGLTSGATDPPPFVPDANKLPVENTVFRTQHGIDNDNASVAMSGSCENLGNWEESVQFERGKKADDWEVKTPLPMDIPIEWKLLTKNRDNKQLLQWEDIENRRLTINSSRVLVNVLWNSTVTMRNLVRCCSPCYECLDAGDGHVDHVTVVFKSDYYCYNKNYVLGIIGSTKALGNWCPADAAIMTASGTPHTWIAEVRIPLDTDIRWKLVLMDKLTSRVVRWEDGDDRCIKIETSDLEVLSPWNQTEQINRGMLGAGTKVDTRSSALKTSSGTSLKAKKSVHFPKDPVSKCKLFLENDCIEHTFSSDIKALLNSRSD